MYMVYFFLNFNRYRPYIGIPLMVFCSALLAYIIYAGETNDGSG